MCGHLPGVVVGSGALGVGVVGVALIVEGRHKALKLALALALNLNLWHLTAPSFECGGAFGANAFAKTTAESQEDLAPVVVLFHLVHDVFGEAWCEGFGSGVVVREWVRRQGASSFAEQPRNENGVEMEKITVLVNNDVMRFGLWVNLITAFAFLHAKTAATTTNAVAAQQ